MSGAGTIRVALAVIVSVLAEIAQAADAVRALPTELSPWAMFMQADIVVKAVMVALAFAAALTWVVLIAKRIEISAANSRLSRVSEALAAALGLEQSRAAIGPKERVAGAMIAHR